MPVHESGRALLETSLPWLDVTKAGTVDPRRVTVPLLFVAAEKDRLVPPRVVQRTAKLLAHVCDYVEHEDQGHRVLGQPGRQRVAAHAEARLTCRVH